MERIAINIILFSESRNFSDPPAESAGFLSGSPCIRDSEEHRLCLSYVREGEWGLQELPSQAVGMCCMSGPLPSFQPSSQREWFRYMFCGTQKVGALAINIST